MTEKWRGSTRATRGVCGEIAQNVAQPMFCKKLLHYLYSGKSNPKTCSTFVTFKKLSKLNSHPMSDIHVVKIKIGKITKFWQSWVRFFKRSKCAGWPDWAKFRLFSSGSFFDNVRCTLHIYLGNFFHERVTYSFWGKNVLGYILGLLLINSSGHPEKVRPAWLRCPRCPEEIYLFPGSLSVT
jgi:hypothetical protein